MDLQSAAAIKFWFKKHLGASNTARRSRVLAKARCKGLLYKKGFIGLERARRLSG